MFYRIAIIAACCIAILLGAPPAAAQAPSLDGYLRLLREAHAAAERRDRIGLEQVAPALVAAREIALPDSGAVPVDNGWLADALVPTDPDMPMIAARLGATIDALSYPVGPPAADAEQRLRELLARPPFDQPAAPPREPNWIERFFSWVFEQLGRMIEPVGQAAGAQGSGLAWAIAIGGGLLVLGVLGIWLRGLRRALAPAARVAGTKAEANLSATEAVQQAGSLAQAGDYRRATRLLYLSSLLWLDERNLLRYERALTNREYLDRLHANPALRERLRPVVETFDRVWYGYTPLDADAFAAFEREVAALRVGSEP